MDWGSATGPRTVALTRQRKRAARAAPTPELERGFLRGMALKETPAQPVRETSIRLPLPRRSAPTKRGRSKPLGSSAWEPPSRDIVDLPEGEEYRRPLTLGVGILRHAHGGHFHTTSTASWRGQHGSQRVVEHARGHKRAGVMIFHTGMVVAGRLFTGGVAAGLVNTSEASGTMVHSRGGVGRR